MESSKHILMQYTITTEKDTYIICQNSSFHATCLPCPQVTFAHLQFN
jgi:hypothetical protein